MELQAVATNTIKITYQQIPMESKIVLMPRKFEVICNFAMILTSSVILKQICQGFGGHYVW